MCDESAVARLPPCHWPTGQTSSPSLGHRGHAAPCSYPCSSRSAIACVYIASQYSAGSQPPACTGKLWRMKCAEQFTRLSIVTSDYTVRVYYYGLIKSPAELHQDTSFKVVVILDCHALAVLGMGYMTHTAFSRSYGVCWRCTVPA